MIILYTVGFFGIQNPDLQNHFLSLSWFILLLSFIGILLTRKTNKKHFLFFTLFCFLLGFSVEYIGVKTGILFGEYSYGENLGLKLFGVPLIIGVNWVILYVCSFLLS